MATMNEIIELFCKAIEKGNVEVVRYFIDQTGFNHAQDYNHGIKSAAECGHVEIVRLLIKDKRVNPAAMSNCALKLAARNGHSEVVKILLKDVRGRKEASRRFPFRPNCM